MCFEQIYFVVKDESDTGCVGEHRFDTWHVHDMLVFSDAVAIVSPKLFDELGRLGVWLVLEIRVIMEGVELDFGGGDAFLCVFLGRDPEKRVAGRKDGVELVGVDKVQNQESAGLKPLITIYEKLAFVAQVVDGEVHA